MAIFAAKAASSDKEWQIASDGFTYYCNLPVLVATE
jgi:hypothetical protein